MKIENMLTNTTDLFTILQTLTSVAPDLINAALTSSVDLDLVGIV